MAKILCSCTGDKYGNTKGKEFQETSYGKGIRIGTPLKHIQGRQQEYSCTICGVVTTKEKV